MNKDFNKGLLLAGFGSFWWGFIGVIYFKYLTFIVRAVQQPDHPFLENWVTYLNSVCFKQ